MTPGDLRRALGDAQSVALHYGPHIRDIKLAVCERYGVTMVALQSRRRARDIAFPRMVAMYLCRELTWHSLPSIGRHFGDRDHTTVLHAIRRVDELSRADADFGERVASLRSYFCSGEREHGGSGDGMGIRTELPDTSREAGAHQAR